MAVWCAAAWGPWRLTGSPWVLRRFNTHLEYNPAFSEVFAMLPVNRPWRSFVVDLKYKFIWCDFDRASSLICGNKMQTRCNIGFYCRSYCLLNMFRASLCPSSGAQEYYTVVAACGISCCVRFAGCCSILQIGHITLSSAPDQQLENHRQQPLYITLELLMMGIVVPETCWASSKICNKNLCCI